jgi:amino acid permease
MNDYIRYSIITMIFIIIINIIVQITRNSSSIVKIIGMISLLVCIFFCYKIFIRGETLPEAPKEKPEGEPK